MILQQCLNKVVVKKQLQELLLTARHSDAVEREVSQKIFDKESKNTPVFRTREVVTKEFCCQGIAMGVGLCANSHLEGTLDKLEEFGKSDAFKKSPSIFNLLKV